MRNTPWLGLRFYRASMFCSRLRTPIKQNTRDEGPTPYFAVDLEPPYGIDDTLTVLNQATTKLQQELVLCIIFIGLYENTFDTIFNESLQGSFELSVRCGVFELKKI